MWCGGLGARAPCTCRSRCQQQAQQPRPQTLLESVSSWFLSRANDVARGASVAVGGLAIAQRKAIVSGIKNAATNVGNTLKKTADAANQGGTDVAVEMGADEETAAVVGEAVEVGTVGLEAAAM